MFPQFYSDFGKKYHDPFSIWFFSPESPRTQPQVDQGRGGGEREQDTGDRRRACSLHAHEHVSADSGTARETTRAVATHRTSEVLLSCSSCCCCCCCCDLVDLEKLNGEDQGGT